MNSINNIMVGNNAGYNFLEGSNNIFIGVDAGRDVTHSNNRLIIKSGEFELDVIMEPGQQEKIYKLIMDLLKNLG